MNGPPGQFPKARRTRTLSPESPTHSLQTSIINQRKRTCSLILDLHATEREIFGDALSSAPGWEMLLALYDEALGRSPPTLSDLAAHSNVSDSSAYRLIHAMADMGLLELVKDRRDKRRVHVHLQSATYEKLDALLDEMYRLFFDGEDSPFAMGLLNGRSRTQSGE
jgi:DNA-binding MarR family transcriptional regulator